MVAVKPRHKGRELEIFMSRVLVDANGCWLWQGALTPKGYGRFGQEKAHRYSYRLFNGVIAEGLLVFHRCDVRNCVNPEHLWLGTAAQNQQDMAVKGRAKNYSHYGGSSPRLGAKLTDRHKALIKQGRDAYRKAKNEN